MVSEDDFKIEMNTYDPKLNKLVFLFDQWKVTNIWIKIFFFVFVEKNPVNVLLTSAYKRSVTLKRVKMVVNPVSAKLRNKIRK